MTQTSLEERERLWEDTKRGELATVARWQMQGSAQGQGRSQSFPVQGGPSSTICPGPWWDTAVLSHKSSQQGWARSGRIREAKSREDFRKMVQRVRELILEVPWK